MIVVIIIFYYTRCPDTLDTYIIMTTGLLISILNLNMAQCTFSHFRARHVLSVLQRNDKTYVALCQLL